MHLPDGFLDGKTALLTSGMAAGGVGIALRHVGRALEARRTPMLGLGAAFIFAAQMLNFPVVGGTSGHLIGGVLCAILLGPGAAVLVMTCVLIVQCLLFADGGLTALGANIFNMAVVNVCAGYAMFCLARRWFRGQLERGTVFAAAFAGWFGTVASAIVCAGELALAGTTPWSMAFAAMTNVHMLIGVVEGLATGLIIGAMIRVRPQWLRNFNVEHSVPGPIALGYGLLVATGLALFVAPFACPWPDAVESLAKKIGFPEHASSALFANYRFPLISSAATATAIAGVIGTGLAFVAAYSLARIVVPSLGTPKKDVSSGT